ncbi:hypothetical protein VDGL01_05906 [Verticillium dahliae]
MLCSPPLMVMTRSGKSCRTYNVPFP